MSNILKHTLGPWQWQHDFNCSPNWCSITAYADEIPTYIADVYRGEADACLIAAAPEMLEALEEVVALQEKHRTSAIRTHICMIVLAEHARAIIAKAKGELP